MKGLLISAPSSNQGKTVVSVGLLGLLRQHLGHQAVEGAKAGPDYIDTAYLGHASRIGLSLDPWAMRPQTLDRLVAYRRECNFLMVEGTMGLFDGSAHRGEGSSASLAKHLGLPVVLVVNCAGMSQSLAAVVLGFQTLDPQVRLGGVILNRVGSERHASMLRQALEPLDVPVLGAIPRHAELALDSRHLGLIQAGENGGLNAEDAQTAFASVLEPHVDMAQICAIAQPIQAATKAPLPWSPWQNRKVAVAQDDAFRFTYSHWHQSCWTRFSPLANQPPPSIAEAIFLPGGYPELHLARLAKADRFWRGLREAALAGVPIYGECGGYMVLGQKIEGEDGTLMPSAGLLPVSTSFKARKRHLGYRQIVMEHSHLDLNAGTKLRGHEFHYCSVIAQEAPNFLATRDARGVDLGPMGHVRGSVGGSYLHLIDLA